MNWQSDPRVVPHNDNVIMVIDGIGEVTGFHDNGDWYITNGGFPEPTIREFITKWRYDYTGCLGLLGFGRDEEILHDNPEYRIPS